MRNFGRSRNETFRRHYGGLARRNLRSQTFFSSRTGLRTFAFFVRKSSRNTNHGFVSGQSYIYHAVLSVHNGRRVNVMHVRILFANPSHNANSVTEFDFSWRANANANFILLILRIKLWPIGVFQKKSIGMFCSHMHPLLNHA